MWMRRCQQPIIVRLETRAIERCLDELARAILYKRALHGLYRAKTYHGIDFVRLCSLALYDQLFAHAIKVLHPREKAGLWYLVKRYPKDTARICAQHSILLGQVRSIASRLILIRNKTLFHLDPSGVVDPSEIWRKADITGRQFDEAVDAGFRLLCQLHEKIKGSPYELPEYDERDATRTLLLADHADLFNHPLPDAPVVTYCSRQGFWLLTSEGERFLSFVDFPWFRDAPVGHILNVEELSPGHYYWPDLDVDLSLKIIRDPEHYPLTGKVK
jgi:hypothetical protein